MGDYIHYHILHIFFSKSLKTNRLLIKVRILSHPLKLGFNYLTCSDLVIEALISNATNRNSVFIWLIFHCAYVLIYVYAFTHTSLSVHLLMDT